MYATYAPSHSGRRLTAYGQPVPAAEGGTTHAAGTTVVVDFNTAGARALTATWVPADGSPAVTGNTQITVREASFGEILDLLAWNRRTWSVPGIGIGIPVEADNSLTWAETTAAGQPCSFLVSTYSPGVKHLLARVPETGDILVYIDNDGGIDHSQMVLSGETTFGANNHWGFSEMAPWDWAESTAGPRYANYPEDEGSPEEFFPVKIKIYRTPN